MRRFFSSSTRWTALAALVFIAAGLSACARYTIHRQTDRRYPRVVKPEEVKCFWGPAPEEGYLVLALVDSDKATTTSIEARERQLEQLRRAAARAGAEAVYDIKQLSRQIHGMGRDPNAPQWVWAPMQVWSDFYILRGVAVVSKDRVPEEYHRYFENPGNPAPEEHSGRPVDTPELEETEGAGSSFESLLYPE